MKTTKNAEVRLQLGDLEGDVEVTIIDDEGLELRHLTVRVAELRSIEDLERAAAAAARFRCERGDYRPVCPDHGYYQASESKSGFQCHICDPKPPARPVTQPDGSVDAAPAGESDELRSAT